MRTSRPFVLAGLLTIALVVGAVLLYLVSVSPPSPASSTGPASVPGEGTLADAGISPTVSPSMESPATVARTPTVTDPVGAKVTFSPTTATGAPPATPEAPELTPVAVQADPSDLISQEQLFTYLESLTAIQPYSGWRNSASEGESQALDYVERTLRGHGYLQSLGMDLERQEFPVFSGTEMWQTRLDLMVDGEEIEVSADGLRAHRDDAVVALRHDSDGVFNDSDRDPVVVEGPVVVVRSQAEIRALEPGEVQGKIVFLDYALIDRVVRGGPHEAAATAEELLSMQPAGLVLVTSFSNQPGESHGTFVGDNSALNWVSRAKVPPTLYTRLEDLRPAGIEGWEDLERLEGARLTWDVDVFHPGTSGNLVVRIPGVDSSRAVILGAHIDSPNSPGALDDGSGSVVLMETARVLDESQTQPPADLYLVWFGGEELGLYGSSHFVATHQELLDRTLAMLQIDMLSRPLDGISAGLTLVSWSYSRYGDGRLLWPDLLGQLAAQHGIQTLSQDTQYFYSDNGVFSGFDVPNADLIYEDAKAMEATGSIHYAAHIHDPYDTVELAREMADVLEEMAQVALTAALDVPTGAADLRVSPQPVHRILFVASHTEVVHMTPTSFADLGMVLAMDGFDVDLVPFGQPVSEADLEDADLVVVLPVVDYAEPGYGASGPDVWTEDELVALENYASSGGLLVLTNSANRLKYGNTRMDPNEDWPAANAVAERFGVQFHEGILPASRALTYGGHPLVEGLNVLAMAESNAVPFSLAETVSGETLAVAEGEPVAVLLQYREAGGQVLVLADVGILGSAWGPPANLAFWRNLARYSLR